VVLTALSGGKLIKLILKFNFLLISRALARFDAETFQRRVNCYIVTVFSDVCWRKISYFVKNYLILWSQKSINIEMI